MDYPADISISMPDWLWSVAHAERLYQTVEERMSAVLDLVALNIADGGGPFAAAVFDSTGRLVGPGVNRVVPASAPIAHAEIVAIAAAGQQLGSWDLRSLGQFQLVTSTEPCAMCLGAVPWSGVTGLVTAARDIDARQVGFDEGDKPENWVANLEARGIEVIRDMARDRAAGQLNDYATSGGEIYNGNSNQHENGDTS